MPKNTTTIAPSQALAQIAPTPPAAPLWHCAGQNPAGASALMHVAKYHEKQNGKNAAKRMGDERTSADGQQHDLGDGSCHGSWVDRNALAHQSKGKQRRQNHATSCGQSSQHDAEGRLLGMHDEGSIVRKLGPRYTTHLCQPTWSFWDSASSSIFTNIMKGPERKNRER